MSDQEVKVESLPDENNDQALSINNSSLEANSAKKAKPPKKETSSIIPLVKMIEAGVHLGLKPNKWNPKMLSYIYAKKINHIIDIKKTVLFLEKTYHYLLDLVKAGGEIIFVGTKNRMVRKIISDAAERVGIYYVTERWLGGTLTNFRNISHSVNKLNKLELLLADDEKKTGYTKKELVLLQKQKDKLVKFYGGIKNMKALPQALVCFDPVEDANAIKEAKIMNISVVAVANTNADPDQIDFIIPANNFSVRSSYLIVNALADAVATANDQPTLVVNRKPEEIILPEVQKRKRPANNSDTTRDYRTKKNVDPESNLVAPEVSTTTETETKLSNPETPETK